MPRCGTRDVALVSVGRNLETVWRLLKRALLYPSFAKSLSALLHAYTRVQCGLKSEMRKALPTSRDTGFWGRSAWCGALIVTDLVSAKGIYWINWRLGDHTITVISCAQAACTHARRISQTYASILPPLLPSSCLAIFSFKAAIEWSDIYRATNRDNTPTPGYLFNDIVSRLIDYALGCGCFDWACRDSQR